MNDMEMLAALGEHLDREAPAALPLQRRRLITAGGGRRRSSVRIPRLRLALTAGVAAVAVASVAGIVIGTGPGRPGAAPSTVRLDSASVTLERAAQTIAARPYATPRPHQWIYTKMAEYGAENAGGNRPTFSETWVRFDGRGEAVFERGKLAVDKKKAGGIRDEGSPEGPPPCCDRFPPTRRPCSPRCRRRSAPSREETRPRAVTACCSPTSSS